MTIQELLANILETFERVGCSFFACEGPDAPFVDMQTCHVCQQVKEIREFIVENYE